MTDSELIWKFLAREFPDNHQVIYLYCKGSFRSSDTAFNKITPITFKTFSPPITKPIINEAIKTFLAFKKEQYNNGEIKVKPLY